MKLSDPVLRSAIRFSFGLGNTTQEMEYTAQKLEPSLIGYVNRC